MGRTVEELDASLSLSELMLWQIYLSKNPVGDDRADWHTAMLGFIMASLWSDSKSRKPKITDFLLKFNNKQNKIQRDESIDVNRWNALCLQSMFGSAKRKG